MQLTMKDVMNLETFKQARVRTAYDYLDERRVEWISVTETPVENFVRKNEIVLTTGIGCDHDLDVFECFVHDVIASEASALAVATGRYIYEIPFEIIDYAEKKQFPIIEIPWDVRFADISHEVMKELTKSQQKDLKTSEKIQRDLLNLILRGGNLIEVAKFVSKRVAAPVFITDSKGVIKGTGRSTREINQIVNEMIQSGVIPEKSAHTLDFCTHHPLHTKIQKFCHGKFLVVQIPIIQDFLRIQGYIFMFLDQMEELDDNMVGLLEHAATASALWFLRENAIVETEMRLRDDYVWGLAKGEVSSLESMRERGKLLGYDIDLQYVAIVGYPENLQHLYQREKQNGTYKQWLQSMIHYIQEEMIFAAESLEKRIMLTYQQDEIIIFLESKVNQKRETVDYFLDLVERRMKMLLPEVMISWGVGRIHETRMFAASYEDAHQSLELGRGQKGAGLRVYYHDTKIDRALLSLAQNNEVVDLASTVIVPLVEYDEQRSMDLINTFIVFTENHYNVSKTARALNLHRQSLLYRLRKIEALTDLSLVHPDHLFLLQLSVRLWQMPVSQGDHSKLKKKAQVK